MVVCAQHTVHVGDVTSCSCGAARSEVAGLLMVRGMPLSP
jgi:hypothetical protein